MDFYVIENFDFMLLTSNKYLQTCCMNVIQQNNILYIYIYISWCYDNWWMVCYVPQVMRTIVILNVMIMYAKMMMMIEFQEHVTSSCLDTGLGLGCGVDETTNVTSNANVEDHEQVVLPMMGTCKGKEELELKMKMMMIIMS